MSQGKGIYQLEYLTIILAYVCVKGVLSDRTSVPFRSSLGLTRALQVTLVGHIIIFPRVGRLKVLPVLYFQYNYNDLPILSDAKSADSVSVSLSRAQATTVRTIKG